MRDVIALHELAKSCPKTSEHGKVIVEVGSWVGCTALAMAVEPSVDRVFCIDTFAGTPDDVTGKIAKEHGPGEIFKTFCQNTRPLLMSKIIPLIGISTGWAKLWPYAVSMVFIDADHSRCAEDIKAWAPHVMKGGILCGHDYGIYDEVTRDVEAFRANHPNARQLGASIWSFVL